MRDDKRRQRSQQNVTALGSARTKLFHEAREGGVRLILKSKREKMFHDAPLVLRGRRDVMKRRDHGSEIVQREYIVLPARNKLRKSERASGRAGGRGGERRPRYLFLFENSLTFLRHRDKLGTNDYCTVDRLFRISYTSKYLVLLAIR